MRPNQINELIQKWAGERPQKVFLYFEEQEINYQQLLLRVNSVANYFLSLGVQKGDRIGLYLRNCPEFLYAWFALNKIGAVMVPINPVLKVEETVYILTDSGSTGVITEQDCLEPVIIPAAQKSPSVKWIAAKGDFKREGVLSFSEFLKGDIDLETTSWDDDEMAAIIYTSGTTGNPKGVMCPHRYYSQIGESFAARLDLTEKDRLLTLLPVFHNNAQVTTTMCTLNKGATAILLDGFHPKEFWKVVSKYEATVFNYLGSMLPILMKMPITREEQEHKVRLAVGAQADPNLFETYEKRWGVTMIEIYGMTEIGGFCNPVKGRRIGSVGLPLGDNRVKIVDDQGLELPANENGEIIITGSSITLGYWKNPEETAKTYRDGWIYSGDIGYLDEDGFLYFVGRKKDIIRRSGENISAVEVENVVMSHPKIVEAAAIPVPDPVRDEEVKVYVVLKEGETPDSVPPEEIIDWCEKKLAKFKVPRYIEYRGELPKTETQKIAKAALRQEKTDHTVGAWDRLAKV